MLHISKLNSWSIMMNLAALVLLTVCLVFVLRKKRRSPYLLKDKLLIAFILLDMLAAVVDAVNYTVEGSEAAFAARLILIGDTVFTLAFEAICLVIVLFLGCLAGEEKQIRKHFLLYSLPALFSAVLVLFNLFGGFLFYVDPKTNTYHFGEFYNLIYISAAIYLAAAVFLMWQIQRNLLLILLVTVAVRIYLGFALRGVSCTTFLFAVDLVFAYICLKVRSILLEFGSVIFLLSMLTAVSIGNIVAVSAFSTLLTSVKERDDYIMTDLAEHLKEYRIIDWLMDYWTEHIDERNKFVINWEAPDYFYDVADKIGTLMPAQLTPEVLDKLTPEEQRVLANYVYESLSYDYQQSDQTSALQGLKLLIQPPGSENAIILFDGDEPGGASPKDNPYLPISALKEAADNYSAATAKDITNWIWAKFTPDMNFGYFKKVDVGEGSHDVYLCSLIKGEEISSKLGQVSGFSTRAMVFLLIISFFILLLLYVIVSRPLTYIKGTVIDYRSNKDAEKSKLQLGKVRSYNEIGVLASEFSGLAVEMDRYTKEVALLAGEKERVDTELGLAWQIQTNMLPDLSADVYMSSAYDIYAKMSPAKEVGGDFYDFVLIDEDHVGLVIGDVSGKGIPAALFMVITQRLISNRLMDRMSPAKALTNVNRQLCERNGSEMFVTVWLAVIELSTGKGTAANAGHENPALRRKGKEYAYVTYKHDAALGVLDTISYHEHDFLMEKGDTLFVYTDGAPEANNSAGKMFGPDRLIAALNRNPGASPKEQVKSVRSVIDSFAGSAPQFDDLTMLAFTLLDQDEASPGDVRA